MGFVKLDSGLLDSSLWDDLVARDVFLAALLMAVPFEVRDPMQALDVRGLNTSGFLVPPGWYGLVKSSGIGIVRRSLFSPDEGMNALERLSAPDPASRSNEYDGRRLARVSGGFLVLNFMVYRDRDYTAALRSKRYRDRKKELASLDDLTPSHPSAVPSRRDVTASHRSTTQAEAEAETEEEAEAKEEPLRRRKRAGADERFEQVWAIYPRRAGGNSKVDALNAWRSRVALGVSSEELHAGVLRYAEFCRATGKLGTPYVMQAARFFGPSSHWEEQWIAPRVTASRSKQEAGIQNLTAAMKRRAAGVARDGQ